MRRRSRSFCAVRRTLLLLAGLTALLLSMLLVAQPGTALGVLAFASPAGEHGGHAEDVDTTDGTDDDSEEEDVDGEEVATHAARELVVVPATHVEASWPGVGCRRADGARPPDVPPPRSRA